MGLINLYDTVSNEHKEIKGNGKLKDLVPEYDLSKCIILKAGNRLDANYIVEDNDIIYLRVTPRAITTVVAVVLAVGVVVSAGYVIGQAIGCFVDAKTKKAQQEAQRQAQTLAQQVQQLPYIRGANNQSALGHSILFTMGDVYLTPYKITDGFYAISGTNGVKQYYNLILSLGYGNLQVKNILCGEDSLVKNESGITSGVHLLDDDSIYKDTDNESFIELRQAGEDFTTPYFKQKVIAVDDGREIKHDFQTPAEPLIRTLPNYTQKVEVCIQFNGLRYFSDGNWHSRRAEIRPYWTNVENPTDSDWNEFYFDGMTNNVIELNSNKTIRFIASKTFTASETYGKTLKIKLVKVTEKLESNSNEECYLCYYQSYCYDNAKSSESALVPCEPIEEELKNKETRLALHFVANDNTKDMLNEFHALVCGMARTWNGVEWSESKSPTRNPASWILEILTSSVHKHSQYSDNEIDLDSLGALYEYCDNPDNLETPTDKDRFYTDGILTQGVKKRDLLSQILNSVNTTMIINSDGLLEFVTDKLESTPVALLNSENIRSISYAKDLTRKADGVKVTFTNRESWQIDTFYAMIDGERTSDSILTDTNIEYVTTHAHAYKMALRQLKKQQLQPREISVDVGLEGDYYPLYSTVMLQYQTFRQGIQSSVISGITMSNNSIVGIKISDMVNFESGKNYGVIIQAQNDSGKKHIYKKVIGSGKTRALTFDSPIVSDILPSINNIISFGELDDNGNFNRISNVMKIVGITPNENGFTLQLRDYNESIYDNGSIPEYKSNITQPPKEAKEIPSYERLEGEKGANGISAFTVQLFKRYSGTPTAPSGTLAYNFTTGVLSGNLEGWTFGAIPPIDEDNNPCYEIHKTITSEENIVYIDSWDAPNLILSDSNLTLSDVEKLISTVTPPPVVDADITFGGFYVDDDGIAPVSQSITSTINVRQTNENLGFEFGDISLPEGFSYTTEENRITISCAKGTLVKQGNFIIPIKYRAYQSNVVYVTEENGFQYIAEGEILGNYTNAEDVPASPPDNSIINFIGNSQESGRAIGDTFKQNTAYIFKGGKWEEYSITPYGYYIYEDKITIYNLGIGYTQVKGGRYLDTIDSISSLPESALVGDFFVWNGEDTSSSLVDGGVFAQTCVYTWNGEKWTRDDSTNHNTRAIFDILKLANGEIEKNNSTAKMFLDRLCSNQAFIKTLVVTGSAFINELQALNIYADSITLAKNEAIAQVEQDIGVDGLTNKTIIDGGYVKTDLINVNEIFTKEVTIQENGSIVSENYEQGKKGFKIDDKHIEVSDGTFYGRVDNSVIEAGIPEWIEFNYEGLLEDAPFYDDISDPFIEQDGRVYVLGLSSYYDENKEYVKKYYKRYTSSYGFTPYKDQNGYMVVPPKWEITLSGFEDNGQGTYSTLKLKNLPDENSIDIYNLDKYTVYVDENGFLKIKQFED